MMNEEKFTQYDFPNNDCVLELFAVYSLAGELKTAIHTSFIPSIMICGRTLQQTSLHTGLAVEVIKVICIPIIHTVTTQQVRCSR